MRRPAAEEVGVTTETSCSLRTPHAQICNAYLRPAVRWNRWSSLPPENFSGGLRYCPVRGLCCTGLRHRALASLMEALLFSRCHTEREEWWCRAGITLNMFPA